MVIEEGQESRQVLGLAQIKINAPNHKSEGVKKGAERRACGPCMHSYCLGQEKNVKLLKRLKRELTLKKFKLRKKAEDLV